MGWKHTRALRDTRSIRNGSCLRIEQVDDANTISGRSVSENYAPLRYDASYFFLVMGTSTLFSWYLESSRMMTKLSSREMTAGIGVVA